MNNFKTGQRLFSGLRRATSLILLVCLASILTMCKQTLQDPKKKVVYTGPLAQTRDVSTLYSDSARLQIRLNAPLQQQYESGDGIYPEGIRMTFYDKKGQVTNTVKANYGKYDKQKDAYFIRGNVILENAVKKETMKTEELHWDKQRRQLFTDKFVTIQTQNEILTGTGLTANQDFSKYKILKPKGIFSVQ